MPSGLKMEFEITPSQVESLALPMHSPTALYITLLYWNAVLNLAVAGFDITALRPLFERGSGMKFSCQGCCFRVELELFAPTLVLRRQTVLRRATLFRIE